MRRPSRPSRFAIVSLLVLLVIGCGLNLYIAHTRVSLGPKPRYIRHKNPDSTDSNTHSKLPPELVREGYESTQWEAEIQWFYGWYAFALNHKDTAQHQEEVKQPVAFEAGMLFVERFGAPFVSRSSKFAVTSLFNAGDSLPQGSEQIWPIPTAGETFGPPAITYHPLGLTLNPIIYALPLWALLMGGRWALVTRPTRKRERLGLCPRCAYDLDGLHTCPECGLERAEVDG